MDRKAPHQGDGLWERRYLSRVLSRQSVQAMVDQALAWPANRGGVFDVADGVIRICLRRGTALQWYLRVHVRWDEPGPEFATVWLIEWRADLVEGSPDLRRAIATFLRAFAPDELGIASA